MTVQIKLSTLTIAPEAFAARVKAFADAVLEYIGHLEGVRLDAANETLKPEERRVAFPPPSEEPLIEQAAREGYEFAGPTLEEKKQALTDEVRRVERETHERVMPQAKRRHWEFREQEIRLRRSKEITKITMPHDFEDDNFLEDHADRKAKLQTVSRWAAKHEHDIADLTDETVETYVVAPLNG
jgi:hypothetical protein